MEKFDIEKFPTSRAAVDMLHSISEGFYQNSYVMKWLLQVEGLEWDGAESILRELPLQFFPETATWGLVYHEQKWQLPVKYNLGYDERRKLIYQRRDFKAPMTPYKMELYIGKVLGIEAHIADCHDPGGRGFIPGHPNIFKATFVTENTLDVAAVSGVLDKLKQSHTVYTIEDLIQAVIDSSSLERFLFRNINQRVTIPFWGGFIFDGTWLFDGSQVFGKARRYGLGILVMYGIKIISNQDKMLYIKYHMHIKLSGKCGALLTNHYSARVLDYSAVVTQRHRFKIKSSKKISLPCVRIKSKQYVNTGAEASFTGKVSVPLKSGTEASSQYHMLADSRKEKAGNFSAETKSENYWLFDGSTRMDGSRKFNSIYRKETE